MNLQKRLEKLQKSFYKQPTFETVFREMNESYEDAVKRGRETYPEADHLIIVSWIQQ
jgi:hypothetical protein